MANDVEVEVSFCLLRVALQCCLVHVFLHGENAWDVMCKQRYEA